MDNETNEDLRNILRRLLSANEVLDHETAITKLVDEHTTPLFVKIATKIFEAVQTLVTEKNLNLRVIVHSAGTGKPGKHQKLTDGSMFHQENQNSIDFEDYDFYQSVYPKVI